MHRCIDRQAESRTPSDLITSKRHEKWKPNCKYRKH